MLKLLDKFKGMARPLVGNGSSCYFWDDFWSNNILSFTCPELHSFAKDKNISLSKFASQQDIHTLFHLPLSTQAFQQYSNLTSLMQHLNLQNDDDTWTYIWGSACFSSHKAYIHLSGHRSVPHAFKWLWDSSCQNKHKVFFWLLLVDRLSTRELLRRKSMHLPSYDCVLCQMGIEESLEHLFLYCEFFRECWATLGLNVNSNISPLQLFDRFKELIAVPFFMEIIILMC